MTSKVVHMNLKLVKKKAENCPKCGSNDYRVITGAKVCDNCFTYFFKELVRDIKSVRN